MPDKQLAAMQNAETRDSQLNIASRGVDKGDDGLYDIMLAIKVLATYNLKLLWYYVNKLNN